MAQMSVQFVKRVGASSETFGVPTETKRAALVSIREMQNRYASGGAGATGSWEAPAAPKARMKFDAQGNPIQ